MTGPWRVAKKNSRQSPDWEFCFSLCRALGFPHPKYLLPLLELEDLYEWMAYYERQPWGEERQDLRNAVLIDAVLRPWRAYERIADSFAPVAVL